MPSDQTIQAADIVDRYAFGLTRVLTATMFWSLGGLFTQLVTVDGWTTPYGRGTLDGPLAPIWVWLVLVSGPHPYPIAGGAIVISAVVVHILVESGSESRAKTGAMSKREHAHRISRTGRLPARSAAGAGSTGSRAARPPCARAGA